MQPNKYLNEELSKLTTLRELHQIKPLTLAQLKKLNLTVTKAYIIRYIGKMLQYIGRQEDMSDMQVNDLADTIIERYYYFSLEEIVLCFRDVRYNPNSYEPIYKQISPATFMGWLQTFSQKRLSELESLPSEPPQQSNNAISREEYIQRLREKAKQGDEKAKKALEVADSIQFDEGQYILYKFHQKHKYDNVR